MATHDKLDELANTLEAQGADELRVQVVRRAREFKRSWVNMAEALLEVRDRQAYVQWGYENLYAYCDAELQIRRATVDKLTGSYVALQRHAPAVLNRRHEDPEIPTCDAVDYFAKALRKCPDDETSPAPPISRDAIDELRHAVFEEGAQVTDLRKRFNPIFHRKSEEAERLEGIRRARATVTRLERLLDEVDGLSPRTVRDAIASLQNLHVELDELLGRTQAAYADAG